jgi:hypothetical protein
MPQINYATALRCIGQDLERRGLKCFEVRCEGKDYTARCGYQDPPAPMPVTIYYRPADIVELDRSGEEKRNQVSPSKDFLNQAQIFRTIGGFLDKNEAKLIRLANNQPAAKDTMLVVEYINRDREHVVDDRAGAAIYDLCVAMYKQRGKLTGTGGARGRLRR